MTSLAPLRSVRCTPAGVRFSVGQREGRDHLLQNLDGRADLAFLSFPQQQDAITELPHHARVMGDHDQRAPAPLELCNLVVALPLKTDVAHREHLVDQENLGLGVHRHREREAQLHTRAVGTQRRIDEVRDLGKSDDVVQSIDGFTTGEAGDDAVDDRVLAAGQLDRRTPPPVRGARPAARSP